MIFNLISSSTYNVFASMIINVVAFATIFSTNVFTTFFVASSQNANVIEISQTNIIEIFQSIQTLNVIFVASHFDFDVFSTSNDNVFNTNLNIRKKIKFKKSLKTNKFKSRKRRLMIDLKISKFVELQIKYVNDDD